jgi:hypothetical protein
MGFRLFNDESVQEGEAHGSPRKGRAGLNSQTCHATDSGGSGGGEVND